MMKNNSATINVLRDGNMMKSLVKMGLPMVISMEENTKKEVKEEAGLDVSVKRVIAVQDREKHNLPIYAYKVCKIFMQCQVLGGNFAENIETTGFRYFRIDELPPLAEEKNTADQIRMCFQAMQSETWEALFD